MAGLMGQVSDLDDIVFAIRWHRMLWRFIEAWSRARIIVDAGGGGGTPPTHRNHHPAEKLDHETFARRPAATQAVFVSLFVGFLRTTRLEPCCQ